MTKLDLAALKAISGGTCAPAPCPPPANDCKKDCGNSKCS
ncbi:hypothetical protein M446_3759 [Methylobacterium sp. 4-46]|nr:hypothetical protein M446_3759 [Methylobacterium sp. 4-46]